MIVEIDRFGLIALVRGLSPSYSQMGELEKMGLGHYTGGFVDQWRWDYSSAWDMYSEEELFALYKSLKDEQQHIR